MWTDEFKEELISAAEAEYGTAIREFLERNADGFGSYREPIYLEAEKRGLPVENLYREEMIDAVLKDIEDNIEEYTQYLEEVE